MSTVIDQEMAARGVAQVIVVLKPDNVPAAAARAAPSGTTAAADVAGPARGVARHFVSAETSQMSQLAEARRPGGRSAARRAPSMRFKVDRRQLAGRYFPNLGVMFGTVNASGLKALQRDPRVETVSGTPALSLIRPTHKAEASLTQRLTWGLRAMKVDRLWKQGLTGRGIVVGHLDTGADGTHPALAQAIAGFAEFDDLGREVRPAPRAYDTDDHGTHTAATIAGRPVRGRAVGVAPGAKLASAIVIEGGDVVARVLGGMDWAVGRGVRILSMSLGFRGYWEDFVPIMRVLRRRNVLPIFAVGNEGPGTSRSPGNYAEAISVGAHDRRKRVADFSSSQRFQRSVDSQVPDLVLPGVGVISARPGGGFQAMDGTSMATPHMAGLAALLIEAHPDRSLTAVETAIFGACARPPGMVVTRGNRGIPDALKALDLLGRIRVGDPTVLERADHKPRPKRTGRPRPPAPAPPDEQRVDD